MGAKLPDDSEHLHSLGSSELRVLLAIHPYGFFLLLLP